MIQPLAGRVRRAAGAARGDPVLHGLRGRDRPPHRRRRAARDRGARPGRPRAAGPSQPGARGPVADVVRHPPGGHEAARGAAQGAAVRRDGLDHEAAAVRARPAVARGHRAGRPGAPADDPDPRVPRAAPAGRRAGAVAGPPERPTRRRRRRRGDRQPTADHPHRARFVQGLADLGRGRARAGRRLAARPPRRHDPALPARGRRRGHARGGRRRRRLGRGRTADATDPLGRPIPARWLRSTDGDARRRRDGGGVRALAADARRARRRALRRRSGPAT